MAVLRTAGDTLHGQRLRGLIIVLWRAGLRISEALALAESDLDARRGAVLVRRGKGGRRREVGMDDWAWQELQPWLTSRLELPASPLFASSPAPHADGSGSSAAARSEIRRTAAKVGVRWRFAPHQLRHAHAVEMAHEGVPDDCHPASTRAQQPRHHVYLPAGHRQRGDHRGRARPPCAHGPSPNARVIAPGTATGRRAKRVLRYARSGATALVV